MNDIAKIRCAPFHGALGADPIGSAGTYDGFLCVEVSPPWERDISLNEPFATLLHGAKVATGNDGRVWRPQGLRRVGPLSDGIRVLTFDRSAGAEGGPFHRREWSVPGEQVLDLCRAILAVEGAEIGSFSKHRVHVSENVIDLLLCTHGKRDVCCGGLGTSLHDSLQALLGGRNEVRLWRTSHTGGHRFAPTALTFPDGYAWAHLNEEVVRNLADRSSSTDSVIPYCRGLSSLAGAPAQVADRAALSRVGWKWTKAERRSETVAFDRESMATTVRITGQFPDGSTAAFDVRVELLRHVPQPTCGAIGEPEYTVEPVWGATSVSPLTDLSFDLKQKADEPTASDGSFEALIDPSAATN